MTDPVRFVVPGRPVSWKRQGRDPRGFTYTERGMRAAQRRVQLCARQAMGRRQPLTGPLRMEVSANQRRKEASTPDVDNLAKLVADALNGVVYADDRQVVELFARKTDVRREDKGAEAWTAVVVTPVEWDNERGWVPRKEAA